MFTVVRYCVQTFHRRPEGLYPMESSEFKVEHEARRATRAAIRRSAGVALYSVRGEPVQRLWESPKLLESYGEILDLEKPIVRRPNGAQL